MARTCPPVPAPFQPWVVLPAMLLLLLTGFACVQPTNCQTTDSSCSAAASLLLYRNPVAEYIFWNEVTGLALKRARPDGSEQVTLRTFGVPPQTLAVVGRRICFVDTAGNGSLSCADPDGTGEKLILNGTGGTGIGGIFFRGDFVYWADLTATQIKATHLQTGATTVLIPSFNFLSYLRDAQNGLMYWTDKNDDEIEYAALDGTGRTTVASTGTSPFGLVTNIGNGRVCYSNFTPGQILCGNGDLSGQVEIATATQPGGMDLDPYTEVLYYTDLGGNEVRRVNVNGGTPVVISSASQPGDVRIMYEQQ